MAVRLFVGNLAYSTTEADLRTYFGAVAPPSQVVLPVDRETGRPRGSRSSSSSTARMPSRRFSASTDSRSTDARSPSAKRAPAKIADRAVHRGQAAIRPVPRPGGGFAPARRDRSAARGPSTAAAAPPGSVPRTQPELRPGRQASARRQRERARRRASDKPRGPIPLKNTGRSFSLDDVGHPDEALPEMDDIATSKPEDDVDKEDE